MKSLRHLLKLIVFFSLSTHAQVGIDSLVTVRFPGEIFMDLDTLIDGARLKQLVSLENDNYFFLQRTKAGNKEALINPLPSDSKSLAEYYDEVIIGMNSSLSEQGFDMLDKSEIEIEGYNAREIRYVDPYTKEIKVVSRVLLLDEFLYSIQHISTSPNSELRLSFFDSVDIKEELNPQQVTGVSVAYRMGQIFGKLLFWAAAILGFIYLVRLLRKEK